MHLYITVLGWLLLVIFVPLGCPDRSTLMTDIAASFVCRLHNLRTLVSPWQRWQLSLPAQSSFPWNISSVSRNACSSPLPLSDSWVIFLIRLSRHLFFHKTNAPNLLDFEILSSLTKHCCQKTCKNLQVKLHHLPYWFLRSSYFLKKHTGLVPAAPKRPHPSFVSPRMSAKSCYIGDS